MYLLEVMIKNFRIFGGGDPPFTLTLNPGVTALVGENDSGKTAIIDAIRYALLTRDVDYIRAQPDDFHIGDDGVPASEIVIRCKLAGLSTAERGVFAEHLTYGDDDVTLYVYWRARGRTNPLGRRTADVSVRSGKDGTGPGIDSLPRNLLAAAYLKPLRDAEREMAPGSGSRLSQVLSNFPGIEAGAQFTPGTALSSEQATELSLVGMAEYFRHLVDQHDTVRTAQDAINTSYLSKLSLSGEDLHGRISYAPAGTEAARLRQVLERLQLDLLDGPAGTHRGRYGLGSNNLLYMACELLLLGKDLEGLPLLLIEEPEAHLQPQRQLRLMEFLENAAAKPASPDVRPVQVIVTTHSPNLASKIPLQNMVLIEGQRAHVLAPGQTKLDKGDYRFLQRFLDSTKANLFFARGVLIVEGDAEAILIPALARLLGRDLTSHGVSIVNVGGTGLRRFARILQRSNPAAPGPAIPVACMADLDVMPDCAPAILDYVTGDDDPRWDNPRRRWRAIRDIAARGQSLDEVRQRLAQDDNTWVRTFVADNWTLEYDLAFAGLARQVYLAALLAKNDNPLNDDRKRREDVESAATAEFNALEVKLGDDREALCSDIYRLFAVDGVSKAVAAQYLVEILDREAECKTLPTPLSATLPRYVVDSINHATRSTVSALSVHADA